MSVKIQLKETVWQKASFLLSGFIFRDNGILRAQTFKCCLPHNVVYVLGRSHKKYLTASPNREDSVQTAHVRSLIRVFPVRITIIEYESVS